MNHKTFTSRNRYNHCYTVVHLNRRTLCDCWMIWLILVYDLPTVEMNDYLSIIKMVQCDHLFALMSTISLGIAYIFVAGFDINAIIVLFHSFINELSNNLQHCFCFWSWSLLRYWIVAIFNLSRDRGDIFT